MLNEPEASLYPDLLPALASLSGEAATRTQVIVVSHALRLIAGLESHSSCLSLRLEKELGETSLPGKSQLDVPAWRWLSR